MRAFNGSLHDKFTKKLKQPTEVYNCKNYIWVRVFKPYGSVIGLMKMEMNI